MNYFFTIILFLLFVISNCKANYFQIYQSDFDTGSLIIDKPGYYQIMKNIVFDPNPPNDNSKDEVLNCCKPLFDQLKSNGGIYDDNAFKLGFFGVIVVQSNDVIIDLNKKTISQSNRFALMQRFSSIIELSSAPFIASQGPSNFGLNVYHPSNITILNGILGQSSHHGIHGNGNVDIKIIDVDFIDFEVAGIHLNGAENVEIINCNMENRKDIPVLGIFSSAIFIRTYLYYLTLNHNLDITLKIRNVDKSPLDLLNNLDNLIFNFYNELIINDNKLLKSGYEYELVGNKNGRIDGTAYGLILNSYGVAVNGFPSLPEAPFITIPTKNVLIDSVFIKKLEGETNEISALSYEGNAVSDPVGAILQLFNKYKSNNTYITIEQDQFNPFDYRYKGNPISDAQIIVAKAIRDDLFLNSNLDTTRNKIEHRVINWVESYNSNDFGLLSNLTSLFGLKFGGDSMFHVNKGLIGFKIDNVFNFTIKRSGVSELSNFALFENIEYNQLYEKGLISDEDRLHKSANIRKYQGANSRAFTFSGSRGGYVHECYAEKLYSLHGISIGYSLLLDSEKNLIKDSDVIMFSNEEYKEKNIGVYLSPESNENTIKNICVSDQNHPNFIEVLDESVLENTIILNNPCIMI